MEFECVTDSGANEQILYFTSPCLSDDKRFLFYISDLHGNPNIWMKDLSGSETYMISNNSEGTLKSYVYFRGNPYIGLGKASVSLDSARNIIYYVQGRFIMKTSACSREPERLAELPYGQMTAFTHVSKDGRYLCVSTVDAEALDGENRIPGGTDDTGGPEYSIDGRIRQKGLSSYIRVFDTSNGREIMCERVNAWVTHVQFSPVNSNHILYNHEYAESDCGIRRLWLYDGERHIRLRTEGEGRSRHDWTCHEMWQADGKYIIYHGCYASGINYIGRVSPRGGDNIEISLPEHYNKYGHFTVAHRNNNLLVTDGCYRLENEKSEHFGGDYISTLKVDWEERKIDWNVICRSGSSWKSQDFHPHPVFSQSDEYIYFTSDFDGIRHVCRVHS